jgi:hypothetical protein
VLPPPYARLLAAQLVRPASTLSYVKVEMYIHNKGHKSGHVRRDHITMHLKQQYHYYWTLCECFEACYAFRKCLRRTLPSFEFICHRTWFRRECRLAVSIERVWGYRGSWRRTSHGRVGIKRILDDSRHALIHFKDKVQEGLNLIRDNSLIVSM